MIKLNNAMITVNNLCWCQWRCVCFLCCWSVWYLFNCMRWIV